MFVFVNVYAPNSGPERQNLFMTLRNAIKEYDGGVCLVIGGDWNCTTVFTLTGMGRSLIVNQVYIVKNYALNFNEQMFIKQYNSTWLRVCDD